MPAGCDPCSSMDVAADVALVGQKRRPRVYADTHSNQAAPERLGKAGRCHECSRSSGECKEERVTLGVNLDPALADACLATQTAMLRERRGVGLRSEFVQQPRRALNVSEEEGDGAGRKVVAHACVII